MSVTAIEELSPYAPHYAELDGARVHYVDEGSGPPLLLLHGNPTWSFLYRDVIAGLRDRFRCIAPDHPGFGLSRPVPAGYGFTPAEHARVLERLVLELDLRDVTMMVQDWGGPIGFAVATRHPDRFAAFVIANTWAWPKTDLPTQQAVMDAYRAPFPTPESRRPVAVFPREILHSVDFLAEVERGLPALRDRRALLVWPTKDVAFRERERRRWESLFPDHRTTLLEGAGHYVQEDAADEIVAAIRGWAPR